MKKVVLIFFMSIFLNTIIYAQCADEIVVDGVTYMKIDTKEKLLYMQQKGKDVSVNKLIDGSGREMYMMAARRRFYAKPKPGGTKACKRGARGCSQCAFIVNPDGSLDISPLIPTDNNYMYGEPGEVLYWSEQTDTFIFMPCGK